MECLQIREGSHGEHGSVRSHRDPQQRPAQVPHEGIHDQTGLPPSLLLHLPVQHDPGSHQRLTRICLHNTNCQIMNWPLHIVNKFHASQSEDQPSSPQLILNNECQKQPVCSPQTPEEASECRCMRSLPINVSVLHLGFSESCTASQG